MWPNVPNFSQYFGRGVGSVNPSLGKSLVPSACIIFTTETRLGSFTDIDIPELQNIPYVKMNTARLNLMV